MPNASGDLVSLTEIWKDSRSPICLHPLTWARRTDLMALFQFYTKGGEQYGFLRGDTTAGFWATPDIVNCYTNYLEGTTPIYGDRIYFIYCPKLDLVKIGYSNDVEARLAFLSNMSPAELVLLGSISGSQPQEAILHRKFSNDRDHGEWFRVSLLMGRYINFVLKKQAIRIPVWE